MSDLTKRLRDARVIGVPMTINDAHALSVLIQQAAERIVALDAALREFIRIDEESTLQCSNGDELVMALDAARKSLKDTP